MLNGNQLDPVARKCRVDMVFELLGVCGMIWRSLTESLPSGGANEARTVGHSEEGRPAHSPFTSKLLPAGAAFKPLRFVVPFLNPLTASCV
jgi:hypothetical protein